MSERKASEVFVLGFSGKIGAGKDYVAKQIFLPLLRKLGLKDPAVFLAFADPIKSECASRYGTAYEKLYVQKDAITRERLQRIGDEIRKKFGEMYFVNWMRMQIRLLAERSGINLFVITDVRFPEEVKMIHELKGLVYRIEAPTRTTAKLSEEFGGNREAMMKRAKHRSEILLDHCEEFDGVIHNDPEDDPRQECSHYSYSVLPAYHWPNDESVSTKTK